MLNIDAAKSVALSQIQLKGSGLAPKANQQILTETQNIGVYDLIFQYLHVDFPTRVEIDKLIKDVFAAHHLANFHLPTGMSVTPTPGSSLGVSGSTTPEPVPVIPREVVIQPNNIKVRSGSPVNSIGYGI